MNHYCAARVTSNFAEFKTVKKKKYQPESWEQLVLVLESERKLGGFAFPAKQLSEKKINLIVKQNIERLIDGEIQKTWLLLHPWPSGQDTLDHWLWRASVREKRRKNLERLFANPALADREPAKYYILLADSVHLVANPALPRTDLNWVAGSVVSW